jgi:hypothetical protein
VFCSLILQRGEYQLTNYVHIFSGCFGSEDQAHAYAEQQLPGSNDIAYIVWEDRNPYWAMREDLNVPFLDGSFIETVWAREDGDRGLDWEYLETLLSQDDVAQCKAKAQPGSDTLILVYQEALGGFGFKLQSPALITYCGRYEHRAYA